jgi:hypothetical protein
MEPDVDRLKHSDIAFNKSLLKATILDESTGNYDVSNLKQRIGPMMRSRLWQFMKDLEILYQSEEIYDDFDEIEHWSKLWTIMNSVDHNTQIGDWKIWMSYDIESRRDPKAVQLGATLAQIPRIISEAENSDGEGAAQIPFEDLVWGVMIGLVSTNMSEAESEARQLEEMLDSLEKSINIRRGMKDLKSTPEVLQRESSILDDIIEESGLTSTPPLRQHLRSASLPNNPDEQDYQETYSKRMANIIEFNERDLEIISELVDDIEQDYERLWDPNFSTMKPIRVVRILGQEDERLHSRDFEEFLLSDDFDDDTYSVGIVGSVLNNLTGEDTTDGRRGYLFDERPVVWREDEPDGGDAELTAYGNLLYHLMDDQSSSQNDPHDTFHTFLFNSSECDPEMERWISTVIEKHYI